MLHLHRAFPGLTAARASLALAALLLSGCSVKTSVQLTATTPANVTHAYVTVEELWFTASAEAVPLDSSWEKEILPEPVRLDLASLNGGTAQTIGSLTLQAGSYAQMRLVLGDGGSLEYVDADGVSRVIPLELANPGGVLQLPVSIVLQGSSFTDAADSGGNILSAEATASIIADVDALRGLGVFDLGETVAVFDPGLRAGNESGAGTIAGVFDLSALDSTAVGSDPGIVVSAETPDTDGARHRVVKSTRLGGNGSFALYPLDGDTTYDIVVHGAGVKTLVITGVTVEAGETTTLQESQIALAASPTFLVNTGTDVHGGSVAEFYQTLPTDSRPYLIESATVNPFAGGFNADLALATSKLELGTYNGGRAISFTDVTPVEGAGNYNVASNSRWRAIGDFVAVAGPGEGSSTPQAILLKQPGLPAGASAGSIAGTLSLGAAGRFDSLFVIVSRGGQIVDSVDLGATIAGRATVNFLVADVPAGTADALYDVSIRAWKSTDPAGTLVRAAFASQADLRQGDARGLSLSL